MLTTDNRQLTTELLLHNASFAAIVPPIPTSYRVVLEGGAMRRCLGKACAGVLLLAVTGCTLDSFLNRQIMVYAPTKLVVPGTVAETAAKLRDDLSEDGLLLKPRTNRVGSDYRIVSQTKAGLVFCLHLQQVNDEDGVKTRVRMQWDRGGDTELWQRIEKILNAPSAEDDSASQQRESSSSP